MHSPGRPDRKAKGQHACAAVSEPGMKTSRKASKRIKAVLVGAGIALALAGVVGTAFTMTSIRKGKTARLQARNLDRDEADAKARMDAEGGAKQPGSPQFG